MKYVRDYSSLGIYALGILALIHTPSSAFAKNLTAKTAPGIAAASTPRPVPKPTPRPVVSAAPEIAPKVPTPAALDNSSSAKAKETVAASMAKRETKRAEKFEDKLSNPKAKAAFDKAVEGWVTQPGMGAQPGIRAEEQDLAKKADLLDEKPLEKPAVAILENSVTSTKLKAYELSDAEITLRCRASIAQKLDMVENAEGKLVPKCVHTYETARAVATSYLNAERSAQLMVSSKENSCDENSSQESCLKAGQNVAIDAMKAHQAMESSASKGEERLVQLVGANE